MTDRQNADKRAAEAEAIRDNYEELWRTLNRANEITRELMAQVNADNPENAGVLPSVLGGINLTTIPVRHEANAWDGFACERRRNADRLNGRSAFI